MSSILKKIWRVLGWSLVVLFCLSVLWGWVYIIYLVIKVLEKAAT